MDNPEDTTTEPTNAATAEPWMQLPLRAFLTADPDLPIAVTLTVTGVDAVLLGRVDASTVEVLREGRIVREPDTTLAAPVTDPTRQVTLLRTALIAAVADRNDVADTAEQTRAELTQQRATTNRALSRLREYAIEQYRDDARLDRDVLNELLDRAGADPYQPRVKVTYTITGTFEVDSDDRREVETNVEYNLRVDLDSIDDVDEDSGDYTVSVDRIEEVSE